jgi:hypothetical protein
LENIAIAASSFKILVSFLGFDYSFSRAAATSKGFYPPAMIYENANISSCEAVPIPSVGSASIAISFA